MKGDINSRYVIELREILCRAGIRSLAIAGIKYVDSKNLSLHLQLEK